LTQKKEAASSKMSVTFTILAQFFRINFKGDSKLLVNVLAISVKIVQLHMDMNPETSKYEVRMLTIKP
jgi:hypothetical protein